MSEIQEALDSSNAESILYKRGCSVQVGEVYGKLTSKSDRLVAPFCFALSEWTVPSHSLLLLASLVRHFPNASDRKARPQSYYLGEARHKV